MQSKDDIRSALKSNQDTLNGFLADLSDQDLAVRRLLAPGTIAWQMGHLITSEVAMGAAIPGASYPELPPGMKETYGSHARLTVPPGGYLKKAELVEWFNKVRSATLAALDCLTDADLNKPTTGPMTSSAQTVGELLWLMANHTILTLNGLMTQTPVAL
jgi:hypothetical protein